ncbi:MAG: hypothetical protein PHU85_10430 [Phycisphaerae bacterium]|nr:hypothetical protein [Phycisphaerae bacterium]
MIRHNSPTPFGMDAPWASPGWSKPGSGGYLAYRGVGSKLAIDYDSPVGCGQPGVKSLRVLAAGHDEDTDYYYALRAVSDSGTEEEGTAAACLVRISGGEVVSNTPNAVRADSCRLTAIAGGKLQLKFRYDSAGERGKAVAVQVCEVAADGTPDWAAPIDTITISGEVTKTKTLTPAWADGLTVHLAVRAVTAGGVAGAAALLAPIAADASSPDSVDYLEAAQI